MNNQLIRDWIDALRSGKYKQGRARLRSTQPGGDAYCCLGVFCDIHPDLEWKDYTIEDKGDAKCSRKKIDCEHIAVTALHHDIREQLITELGQEVLIGMNDRHKATFDEIADYLEKQLEQALRGEESVLLNIQEEIDENPPTRKIDSRLDRSAAERKIHTGV